MRRVSPEQMTCMLCGAQRYGKGALIDHFVFWHDAPLEEARAAAGAAAVGAEFSVKVRAATNPAAWLQLSFPEVDSSWLSFPEVDSS